MAITSSFSELIVDQILWYYQIVHNFNERAVTHTHTHTHTYIYIYTHTLYIYIYIYYMVVSVTSCFIHS